MGWQLTSLYNLSQSPPAGRHWLPLTSSCSARPAYQLVTCWLLSCHIWQMIQVVAIIHSKDKDWVLLQRQRWRSTMMTSSSGNIFRVTGPLWGESTGHPLSLDLHTRIDDTILSGGRVLCFLLINLTTWPRSPSIVNQHARRLRTNQWHCRHHIVTSSLPNSAWQLFYFCSYIASDTKCPLFCWRYFEIQCRQRTVFLLVHISLKFVQVIVDDAPLSEVLTALFTGEYMCYLAQYTVCMYLICSLRLSWYQRPTTRLGGEKCRYGHYQLQPYPAILAAALWGECLEGQLGQLLSR